MVWNRFLSLVRMSALLMAVSLLGGCVLTRVVTVPMRLGGAVISIIPVVGDTAHDSIDEAAEIVDEIPL